MANNTNENTTVVGKTNFLSFSWRIDEFAKKMKMEIGEMIESEVFSGWNLCMYPYGRDEKYERCVGLYLKRRGIYNFQVKTKVSYSIVDKGGKKAHLRNAENTFMNNHQDEGRGYNNFISHSLLVKFQDSILNLLPDDSLTILCEIRMAAGDSGTGEAYKAMGGFALERDVTSKAALMTRLSSDMLSIMADKFADFEIVCDGQKFPCHKNVLASRSPVFDAMLSLDMEEKRKSSVEILDLDYSTVRDMLLYIYSGHVDGLKVKAMGLLAAAEKYDLKELKQVCEVSLSENIDEDNVLDMVVLADLHRAGMVRDIALKFIVCNGEEILAKPDWRDKLEGHPEILKDLFEFSIKKK